MNPAQLSALFAQHRVAVLGGAAAAVAGLALWQRRVKPPTAGGTTTTAGATVPGTSPAAAVVPAGGYDSSASDVYNALQSQLEQIMQTQGAGTTTAPAPVASTLFSPTGSGTYVSQTATNGAGTGVFEVESDGSLFHLTGTDWGQLIAANQGQAPKVNQVGPDLGTKFYTESGNLAAKNGGTGPAAFTTNAAGNYVPYVPTS